MPPHKTSRYRLNKQMLRSPGSPAALIAKAPAQHGQTDGLIPYILLIPKDAQAQTIAACLHRARPPILRRFAARAGTIPGARGSTPRLGCLGSAWLSAQQRRY